MGNRLNIQEVINITGKSKTAIYRIIKSGKLKTHKREKAGKPIYEVDIKDLEEFLGYPVGNRWEEVGKGGKPSGNQTIPLTEEKLIDTIERMFSQRETALMKHIEDMAIYKLGQMENEVQHLRAEKETLLQELEKFKALPVEDTTPIKEENHRLKEQLAILPAEVDKVNEMLKLSSEKLIQVEDENQKISKILMQNADNITVLQKHKDNISKQLNEKEQALKKQAEEKEHLELELRKLQLENEDMQRRLSTPWWKWKIW